MEIRESRRDELVVLELAGRLDAKGAKEVERHVSQLIAAHRAFVILELTGVEAVDSAGLRSVLRLHRRLEAGEGFLMLSAPSPTVREALEVSGVDRELEIASTLDRALARATPEALRADRTGKLAARLLGVPNRVEDEDPRSAVRELGHIAAALIRPNSSGSADARRPPPKASDPTDDAEAARPSRGLASWLDRLRGRSDA
ncbi:MAG: STAS domain-containing protein [Acidobacteriota bacterium]